MEIIKTRHFESTSFTDNCVFAMQKMRSATSSQPVMQISLKSESSKKKKF